MQNETPKNQVNLDQEKADTEVELTLDYAEQLYSDAIEEVRVLNIGSNFLLLNVKDTMAKAKELLDAAKVASEENAPDAIAAAVDAIDNVYERVEMEGKRYKVAELLGITKKWQYEQWRKYLPTQFASVNKSAVYAAKKWRKNAGPWSENMASASKVELMEALRKTNHGATDEELEGTLKRFELPRPLSERRAHALLACQAQIRRTLSGPYVPSPNRDSDDDSEAGLKTSFESHLAFDVQQGYPGDPRMETHLYRRVVRTLPADTLELGTATPDQRKAFPGEVKLITETNPVTGLIEHTFSFPKLDDEVYADVEPLYAVHEEGEWVKGEEAYPYDIVVADCSYGKANLRFNGEDEPFATVDAENFCAVLDPDFKGSGPKLAKMLAPVFAKHAKESRLVFLKVTGWVEGPQGNKNLRDSLMLYDPRGKRVINGEAKTGPEVIPYFGKRPSRMLGLALDTIHGVADDRVPQFAAYSGFDPDLSKYEAWAYVYEWASGLRVVPQMCPYEDDELFANLPAHQRDAAELAWAEAWDDEADALVDGWTPKELPNRDYFTFQTTTAALLEGDCVAGSQAALEGGEVYRDAVLGSEPGDFLAHDVNYDE